MAVDLVCGMIVDEGSAPAKTTYAGDDYHFCATYCRDVFSREPEKFINGSKQWGRATDPVCGMTVEIPNAAAMSIHNGRFIYFCNRACKEKFDADPEKYLKLKSDGSDKKQAMPDPTAKALKMVEEAQGSKPPIARLADIIAGYFVPTVIGIAVITFAIWYFFGPAPALTYAVLNFVAVLIIACPCALGLATPTSIMVGTGKGAESGVLIRGGETLETAHKLKAVVLDKTGTLTEGKPSVTDIAAFDGFREEEILRYSASAEKGSEHPLGEAIVNSAMEKNLPLISPDNFNAIAGHGIEATIEGKSLLLGNVKLMRDRGVPLEELERKADAFSNQGKPSPQASLSSINQG